MKPRTFLWAATAAGLALVTVAAPAGRPQPGPPLSDKRDPSVAPAPSTPLIPPPDIPSVPGSQAPSAPSAPAVKPAPPPPTVDELLASLEAVQKQKADLEKQEQALKVKLRERLKDQQDRLQKVGMAPEPAAPPVLRPADGKDMIVPPLLQAK